MTEDKLREAMEATPEYHKFNKARTEEIQEQRKYFSSPEYQASKALKKIWDESGRRYNTAETDLMYTPEYTAWRKFMQPNWVSYL